MEMHHFIEDVLDVGLYADCGYHLVVAFPGIGENSWPLILQEYLG